MINIGSVLMVWHEPVLRSQCWLDGRDRFPLWDTARTSEPMVCKRLKSMVNPTGSKTACSSILRVSGPQQNPVALFTQLHDVIALQLLKLKFLKKSSNQQTVFFNQPSLELRLQKTAKHREPQLWLYDGLTWPAS